jgi:EpsI family protein
MTSQRRQTLLLTAALLGTAALAWTFQLRPALEVDASALERLPTELAGWSGRDIPVESTVERMLRADFNLQRAYRREPGQVIWLYLGYYGTERGGRPEHAPQVCYPSAGWTILEERPAVVADRGGDLRVNELVVENQGERRLVYFWYHSHRRSGLRGDFELALDRLQGRLLTGRADGALVRLSTPLDAGGKTAARTRLAGFASQLDPLLTQHWPTEEARGD